MRKKTLWLIWILGTVLLWELSRVNYLFFHSIIETLAIVVGFSIFVIAVFSYRFIDNLFIKKLGIVYSAVIIVDFVHMLSYKNMGVFLNFDANQPTQFWILGRVLETFGLLYAVALSDKHNKFFCCIFYPITAAGIWAVFARAFPDCFIEGQGLTQFKVFTEYVLVSVIVVLLFYAKKIKKPDIEPYKSALFFSLAFTALAELSFTLYSDVFGFFNMLGHLFRLMSYVSILNGIVIQSIKVPLRTLYNQVHLEKEKFRKEAHLDSLTGVNNRRFLELYTSAECKMFEEQLFSVAMIDVDNFKEINDRYSHMIGDEVLKVIAKAIKKVVRKGDIVIRYGGDEFLVIFPGASAKDVEMPLKRVQKILEEEAEKFKFSITISYGIAEGTKKEDFYKALKIADKRLYEMKQHMKELHERNSLD
ncbi:sensor domain-containing diguanylate cyclase [Kosmotoga pacifica]|uniref:GGDEF domain-containing protein n=1 Tax=Kosmotoga pacifica TaxID=1330330 RepID=A0A0G2ZCJ2_9BACT|nr:GGDEF domain-containing protein [Kosmotoga pacifica]AKI97821.1 hypothetical protein IX53_08365 [Kosmotoga pacifica]